jgi:hypothetical protein
MARPNPPTGHCGCYWANLEMRGSTLPWPTPLVGINRKEAHT